MAAERCELPDGFADLEPFAATWALATQNERVRQRISSQPEELEAFYASISGRMEEILILADEFPLRNMPEPVVNLFYMALSVAEIAPHVELYRSSPLVPFSFDERRFSAAHGDNRG